MKPTIRGLLVSSTALSRLGTLTAGIALLSANAAVALPQNGSVAAGSATIGQTSSTQLDITQASDRAVIDWRSFSIAANEITNFHQPSANSIAVNRVTGIDPSQIMGRLTANGQVVLVNPNGILFGKGAQVNVGGLVASTASITTQNAMTGNMVFDQPGNPNATVENQGAITAAQGGLVALVAPGVANSGTIIATMGKVSLASGNKWTMDLYGDHLVNFAVNDQVASKVVGVTQSGRISAQNVELSANVAKGIVSNVINMSGIIEATNASSQGGTIILSAPNSGIAITGSADASGTSGGTISVAGDSIIHQGTIDADGFAGSGGSVTLTAESTYIDTANATTTAKGSAHGGSIAVSAGTSLYTSGSHRVTSSGGIGGNVTMTAPTTNIVGAAIDASGAKGGGTIGIGGGPHGSGTLAHSSTTNITPSSIISASAIQTGNGGIITIWSDEDTNYAGATYAKGGIRIGNGGTIEVSSAGSDHYAGFSDASAPMGNDGQLLLDPKTIIVDSAAALFPQFQFLNPNSSLTGTFGSVTVDLSGGNVVISDPTTTIGLGPVATGAAYLFNGLTGQLISALTGTYLNDRVGTNVTALTNGNFVVSESTWNGGKGAATFAFGNTGVNGAVSASNSLTGSAIGDNIGLNVTALTNGNFVVGNSNWNGGTGAATWASGSLGVSGTVSASNSLIGSSVTDHVGLEVTTLAGGDYVVQSPNWNNNKGAASWANGTTGITGTVSAANSLVGNSFGDQVGLSVTALTSGDYLVGSPNWNSNKGAATWADGSGGVTGTITAANSFIGSLAGDEVGFAVTALANGDYVVGSPNWNGNKGAASWGNGMTGITGTVTASNSLIGSLAGDKVGLKVTALSNSNYVVGSPNWSLNTGAATWASGSIGIAGTISSTNSLIGSGLGDQVGLTITALTNGNYVVGSPDWALAKGAATWGNGAIGVHGTITSANSLIGSTATDQVGLGVTALTNGNYVVQSPLWNATMGAASFASGTVGLTGMVSSVNSLVGSLAVDEVGLHVAALTNGNYVVGSPLWNGTTGAATWASGTIGITGTVTSTNSLTGSLVGDLVGSSVTALTYGAYVVGSFGWNSGLGAATYGEAALTGVISTTNSIVGHNVLTIPMVTVSSLANGNFTVSFANGGPGSVYEGFTNPNQLTYSADTNGTVTIAPSFVTQVLNTGTAVTLQANDDIQIDNPIITTAGGNGGALTLQSGRSLILNGNIVTDNGNLTLIANDTLADGVVSNARDAGSAVISMGVGTVLNAGSGTVSLTTKNGAGIDNATSGGITLNNISGSKISIVDQTQNTLTLNGALTATASGNSIVISTGTIINNYGITALSPGAGRYILYSFDPATDALNGLANFAKHYDVSYTIDPPSGYTTGGNYSFYSITPTITLTGNDATRVYGSANPAISYSASGLIDGDTIATALTTAPIWATSATTSSNDGAYNIGLLNSPTSSLGYNIVTINGVLSITPAALTITSGNANRLYGAANPSFSASYSGFVNGDNSSVVSGLTLSSTATAASNVGNYSIIASGATAANYSINYGSDGTLSVLQAPLTITANNASRVYGANNPIFSATYSGLVNGDSSGVVTNMMVTTTATSASNIGSYAITVSNGVASDYAIIYGVNGTLSVTPAALTITSANSSRVYGQVNPGFNAIYSGLVNGDASNVVSGLSLTTTATLSSNVGLYAISASSANATNYTISYGSSGILAVAPAALTITPTTTTRLYGANNTFSASFSGLTAGDTSAAISGLTLSSTATSSSNVGSYAITASGGINSNYTISYGPSAMLTVTPAPLTITPNNSTRLPGTSNSLSATYDGLTGGDATSNILGLTLATSATASSPIGQYSITASGAINSNYTIFYGPNGTLFVVSTLPAPPQPPPVVVSRFGMPAIPTFERLSLTNGPIKNARFNETTNEALTPIIFPITINTEALVASTDAVQRPNELPLLVDTTNLVASIDRSNFVLSYLAYDGNYDEDPKMLCLKVSYDSTGNEAGDDDEDSCAAPLTIRGF